MLPTIPIYYAHPYSAYERGLNEKQNSLIRRFLQKGRSFDGIANEKIQEIQNWINQLPRKSFHYSSPDMADKRAGNRTLPATKVDLWN